MRIAIFGTNYASTPPSKKQIYAPLNLAWYLAEGLVKKGHKVFLFGSSDSKTSAKLISNNLPSFGKNKEWNRAFKKLVEKESLIMKGRHEFTWATKWKEVLRENYELMLAVKLQEMAQKGIFDVIQFHSPLRVLHFTQSIKAPVFFTMHDPVMHPFGSGTVKTIAESFKKVNFISISNAQKKPAPKINWVETVYNGTDTSQFKFSEKKGSYLAFAGRIVPQKGLDIAVKVAKTTNKRLRIAGPINAEHQNYWDKEIKPYLSSKITYEGTIPLNKIQSFYQGAEALLMPILWAESFGLVMTEAMACGTPVIAFNKGSVPEVIKNKKTGFIVKNEKQMIKAVKNIDKIKRQDCRRWVVDNFSIEKMVDNYEKLYLKLSKNKTN